MNNPRKPQIIAAIASVCITLVLADAVASLGSTPPALAAATTAQPTVTVAALDLPR